MPDQTFQAGPVAINYVAEGVEDGPPLVFLHGVTGRWQAWLPVMTAVADEWRVYALDLRGHGRSGHVPDGYRLAQYAQDVAAFLEGVVGRPAVLVGHSLGAMISIAVAAEAGALVRAAVLEDPPLGAFSDQVFTERAERPRFTRLRDLARANLPPAALFAALVDLDPGVDPAATGGRVLTLSQMDPEVLTAVVEDRAKEGYDLAALLGKIACPVLLQQGNPAHGAALEDERAARAMSLLKRGTFRRYDHVGHGIHAQDPFGFCRDLREYLATL